MKKVEKFRQILNQEIPKFKTESSAFRVAKQRFETEVGINAYSSLVSFKICEKKTIKKL